MAQLFLYGNPCHIEILKRLLCYRSASCPLRRLVRWTLIPMVSIEQAMKLGADAYAQDLEFQAFKAGRVSLALSVPFCHVDSEGVLEFNYHAGQSKVMTSSKRFIVALAGRQGGKSECCAPWLYNEMRARGPGLYMVVAPSYPILFDSVYPKIVDLFKNKLDLGKTRSHPFSFIISKQGEDDLFHGTQWEKMENRPETVIRFCHAADADSLEAKTALACVFDEAGQSSVGREAFEAIIGRLTTTMGRLLLTTTPYTTNALYTDFYKPWRDEKDQGKEHEYIDVIQYKSTMNPRFTVEEYERLRGTMPAWKHAMFYDGEFTRPAGQIYDCFSDDEGGNVVPPRTIPDHWPRYSGHDFGGNNTTALWVALDPDEMQLYLYRSYKRGQLTAKGHIRNFLAGEMDPEKRHSPDDFPDRAMGGNSGEQSVRDEYTQAGYYIEKPIATDRGSVELGIDSVYGLLAARRLRLFSDQEDVIAEIQRYSREIDSETGDPIPETIDNKSIYHYCDALRYICLLLSRLVGTYQPKNETIVGGKQAIDPRYIEKGEQLKESLVRGNEDKMLPSSDTAWGQLGFGPGGSSLPLPMTMPVPAALGGGMKYYG